MAEKEVELALKWENNVNFTMTAKQDNGIVVTVVSTDENNHIADTWESISETCRIFFSKKLVEIGKEMMS